MSRSTLITILEKGSIIIPYFRFEWQKAKITVSKLKCDPYEEHTLEDRLDQLDDKITNMKSQIDQKITNLQNSLNSHRNGRSHYGWMRHVRLFCFKLNFSLLAFLVLTGFFYTSNELTTIERVWAWNKIIMSALGYFYFKEFSAISLELIKISWPNVERIL